MLVNFGSHYLQLLERRGGDTHSGAVVIFVDLTLHPFSAMSLSLQQLDRKQSLPVEIASTFFVALSPFASYFSSLCSHLPEQGLANYHVDQSRLTACFCT